MRRSRTESSAAPPAIEELAGEARQVRPARAACGSVSTDYGLLTGEEVWRATGPPAPSTNNPARKFSISPPSRPRTAEAGNSRPGTVFTQPKRSGGRPALQHPRASFPYGVQLIPPHPDRAPQKQELPASVPSSPIRRGLEGDRPSSTLDQQSRTEVQHIASIPTAHHRSRKFPLRYCLHPSKKGGCRKPAGDCNSPLWSYSMKRRFIRSCCRPPKSDRCRPDSPPVCSGRGRAGRCHGRRRSGTRRSTLRR